MLLGARCGRGVSFYSMGMLTWTRNSSSLPSSRGYGLISTTEPCEAVFLISETPLAEKSPKLHYGERLKPNSLAKARAKNEGKEHLPRPASEREIERERESGGGGKQEW